MQLDYGKGQLMWNTLDLEDDIPLDAGTRQLGATTDCLWFYSIP